MTTPAAPAAIKTSANLTEYVILTKLSTKDIDLTAFSPGGSWSTDDIWAYVKTVKARSANEAVKQAVNETAGTFMAIPKRSWQPVKVTVETKTTIKLG